MAPKKKAGDGAKRGKSAKKTKAPEFITDEADCLAFGLRYQDIVRTPLGLTGKVLGVKYDVRPGICPFHELGVRNDSFD